MAFLNIPALLIIVGGTSGAVDGVDQLPDVHGRCPSAMIMSFKGSGIESGGVIQEMVTLAEKARRNGLLALEEDVAEVDDAYTKKGLQLVVDGTDSDLVRDDPRVGGRRDGRSATARSRGIFTTAGGFAPTLGILGTVMGLVHVLENLFDAVDARPRDRGRVHRDALRRRQRQPALPARSATSSRRCRPTRSTTARWCSRPSSRSRPATTRACSPRSSRPSCRRPSAAPPEKGAPAVGRGAR